MPTPRLDRHDLQLPPKSEQMYALYQGDVDELDDLGAPRSGQLAGGADNAALVLAYGVVYGKPLAEIRRALALGAQAAAARFAVIGAPATVPLGRRPGLALPQMPLDSRTHARAWQQGLALAAAAGDEAALARLAAVDHGLLARSPTRVDRRELDLCRAQAALVHGQDPAPLLAQALDHPVENTAPDALPVARARVELYRATLADHPDEAVEAYHHAWRSYWSRGEQRRQVTGAVSLDGLGWLGLRRRAGRPDPGVASDYLPPELLADPR